jgi:hypothetical protein
MTAQPNAQQLAALADYTSPVAGWEIKTGEYENEAAQVGGGYAMIATLESGLRVTVGRYGAVLAEEAPEAAPADPDRDTRPVTIERSDAITAAGGCTQAARRYRLDAKLRGNGGPRNASHRRWLRAMADEMDATAQRLQRVADEAVR